MIDRVLALAMGGTGEDLAEARLMMDNINSYADLNSEDFEYYYSRVRYSGGGVSLTPIRFLYEGLPRTFIIPERIISL